ncbi:GNAT family N-acetyltransferase [Candidatus Woesearchaeota archaeon]|nr:GNAT family N-acetyltransferase [Candidatus Woesearchaeota archaeon]
MNNIKVRLAKNKKELMMVFKIRKIVFIKEQNVSKNIERDEFDKTAKHFALYYKNRPVGCARIRFINRKAKLERIAVLKEYRGKGFGKIIVDYLIKYCKKKKMKKIFMNAQYYLKDYYKKLGFKPKGIIFEEAGIKHIKMYFGNK